MLINRLVTSYQTLTSMHILLKHRVGGWRIVYWVKKLMTSNTVERENTSAQPKNKLNKTDEILLYSIT